MRAPVTQRTLYPLQGLDVALMVDSIRLQIYSFRMIAFYVKTVFLDCGILKGVWMGQVTVRSGGSVRAGSGCRRL